MKLNVLFKVFEEFSYAVRDGCHLKKFAQNVCVFKLFLKS